jgi:hypothetical protein
VILNQGRAEHFSFQEKETNQLLGILLGQEN